MPVRKVRPVPSDIEIAQAAEPYHISEVAEKAGILPEEMELHGNLIAKIDYAKVLERLADKPNAPLVTVTAMTPTPLGEGKTVTAFTLGQAFALQGRSVVNTFRQPSKGPTFGIKGGAAGGGYSQALPMESINLHFTGDVHACETAQNLCAAAIDAHIHHYNPLNIDPQNITWSYCQDLNSRALRNIVIGLGGRSVGGFPRAASFDITVATETAAIVALTTGLRDLRERIGRAVIGYTRNRRARDRKAVTTEELEVAGAMTALLMESIKPNLVQSTEGHPMICHGYPFANVAHGNNSNLANMVAMKLADDVVVTESGFGADCGFSKLVEVGARQAGFKVDCAVIVCTIRALKQHGGAFHLTPGMAYSRVKEAAETENLEAVENGFPNLRANINIVKGYGVPAVVVVNRFTSDTDAEVQLVKRLVREAGADGVAEHTGWANGGEGGQELANEVWRVLQSTPTQMAFKFEDDIPLVEKVRTLAQQVYGANDIELSTAARQSLQLYQRLGFGWLTVNMAKTHLSLSHDPAWLGVPTDYVMPIRDVRASVGAGFIYPICGAMSTMPGLPSRAAYMDVDVNLETGNIVGLF